jgi:transcription elongation factor GreA
MSSQMTKASYEKLKKQVKDMIMRRSVISKAIGEAREHGDLKENSAYHAAKEEQGLNEMRIRDLEARIESAVIVNEKDMLKKDKVKIGTMVKVKDLKSGNKYEYAMVDVVEADILENKISTESPLGFEIYNKKVGDVVEIEAPVGKIKYKILEIK